MASLNKIPVSWTGGTGGAGVSVFYADSLSAPPVGALATFFGAIKAMVPSNITWTIPNAGDTYDVATGALVNSWVASGPTVVAATGSPTSYSGGSGVVVRWNTAGIVGRRRVKGRTFIVPVVSAIYDNGSILSTQLAVFQSAATALVASAGADLRIWHRPVSGIGGQAFPILSGVAPDLAAVLRSRRD